jgi:hypothetical protein
MLTLIYVCIKIAVGSSQTSFLVVIFFPQYLLILFELGIRYLCTAVAITLFLVNKAQLNVCYALCPQLYCSS